MLGNATNVPLQHPYDSIGESHYWVSDGVQERIENQIKYFTEWQSGGNGVFTPGWNSINSPGVEGGIHYLLFHMNWGWQSTSPNGWYAFNDVNAGNGNDFKYARYDFYITKPYNYESTKINRSDGLHCRRLFVM